MSGGAGGEGRGGGMGGGSALARERTGPLLACGMSDLGTCQLNLEVAKGWMVTAGLKIEEGGGRSSLEDNRTHLHE